MHSIELAVVCAAFKYRKQRFTLCKEVMLNRPYVTSHSERTVLDDQRTVRSVTEWFCLACYSQ
jgi:hypothetical protein